MMTMLLGVAIVALLVALARLRAVGPFPAVDAELDTAADVVDTTAHTAPLVTSSQAPAVAVAAVAPAASTPTTTAVAQAWRASIDRLVDQCPDLVDQLAAVARERPKCLRELAKAGAKPYRWSGRVLRGQAPVSDLEARLQVWERFVLGILQREQQ